MSGTGYIEHLGIIENIAPQHIQVRIVSESACASCHAKGACTAADLQDKLIDVYESEGGYKVGQQVMVMGKKSLAPKAVLFAYVYPLILILLTLVLSFYITANELLSGILSLVILAPYFIGIYFLKDKLERTFSFTIKQ